MKFSPMRGFTLIELLVVVAIIGVLSSVVLTSVNSARRKGKNINKIEEIKQLQIALELYRDQYGHYPLSHGDPAIHHATWRNECDLSVGPGTTTDEFFIPELVTTGLFKGKKNTSLSCSDTDNGYGYSYGSNGIDYKLLVHTEHLDPTRITGLIDPADDDGPDHCVVDGPKLQHFGVWTPGAQCWIEFFECDYPQWCITNG